MMTNLLPFTFLIILPSILAQRGHYAGSRTQGYKDKYVSQTDEQLANRFQVNEVNGTTQRIPVNAHGDRGLVDRIAQMPREKQPFWYINANILEAQRNSPFPIVQGQSVQGNQAVQRQTRGANFNSRGGFGNGTNFNNRGGFGNKTTVNQFGFGNRTSGGNFNSGNHFGIQNGTTGNNFGFGNRTTGSNFATANRTRGNFQYAQQPGRSPLFW